MAINLTDSLNAATTKGKLGDAKQVYLNGDTKNLQQAYEETSTHFDTLDNRSTQMENAIQDISVTGGASTANAVSYNNSTSKLEAITAQGAIDEISSIVIYDVSARNNGAVFESLQALLSSSSLSTLIPTSVRHGGMSIRFIQGSKQSSDNKYVQYRLITTAWSNVVTDWQGVDDEPTARSENFVKSGGVANITNALQNKTLNIDYINYPFAISDSYGNVIYLIDFKGDILKAETETEADELYCNYPFAIMDDNGNVPFLVSHDGTTYNVDNTSELDVLNFRLNSDIAINSLVVSPLQFIHAFSVSAVSKRGGDIFFIYMASETVVDEHYTSDASWIELSKFNVCKPSETTDIQVIRHGDIINGVTINNPYNMLVTKSADESTIYCHFGCIPTGETTPVYATIPVNSSTLEKGTFQQNTLTYSVNESNKTVKYSMDNYLTMLYELGLTDSKIEYGDYRKTTDNSIPYFYNGKFYKVESHSADEILPIILVSSVDMINWKYEKVIASGFKADELSIVIKDNIIYISFRQDGGDGMRYYVYDLNNDIELASGRFDNGILARPMTFLYKNEVYICINTRPAYYGNSKVPSFDLANRQEISIFRMINYLPVLVGKMTNPNGINYHFELPYMGTDGGSDYGDYIDEENLYLFFSEDRRKVFQVRQFSDIAFCNITNMLNFK